jgi:hypothetical protein
MKSSIFWDIKPCSPLKVKRCFGGAFRLHIQGGRISPARNQGDAGRKQTNQLDKASDYTGKCKMVPIGSPTGPDRSNGNWHSVLLRLSIHSVLWMSRRELTYCLAFPSVSNIVRYLGKPIALLATRFTNVFCLAYFPTLKMEATISCETC